MLITKQHYTIIKNKIEEVIIKENIIIAEMLTYYHNNNIGKDKEKRLRNDLTYKAGLSQFITKEIYQYANDNHLDTALKNIVRELSDKQKTIR